MNYESGNKREEMLGEKEETKVGRTGEERKWGSGKLLELRGK